MGPQVLILIGSESDREAMQGCLANLDKFGVSHELVVSSAHRSPEKTRQLAEGAKARGVRVMICGAGMSAALAAALFAVHAWRLSGWHTGRLWKKPLLWVLYLAYAFIVFGFALKAVQPWYAYAGSFALHAFAYGGIGLMTAGMLSRVSLGHTGRDLRRPPLRVLVDRLGQPLAP